MDSLKNQIMTKIKDSIDYLSQGSYKINGLDHFTPVWYMIGDIANILNLDDYGFDLDDYNEDGFEDAEEVRQDYADILSSNAKEIIGYQPSQKDISHSKKIINYIDSNFNYGEILDTYNFDTPMPLTYKDIMNIVADFSKALKKAPLDEKQIRNYYKIAQDSVQDWAD